MPFDVACIERIEQREHAQKYALAGPGRAGHGKCCANDKGKGAFMAVSRRAGKFFAWVLAVLAALIAALVVFILTFDWNRARPYISDKVSEAIGRPFAIEGDLKVGWRHPVGETGWRSWVPWPRFSAENITVANPDWSKQKHFATLDEIDFQVKVLPLLAHDIVI